MRVEKHHLFNQWYERLSVRDKGLVSSRIFRIEENDYLGDYKYIGGDVFELRWKNGLRIYFSSRTDNEGKIIFLLLGGTKHGQNRDIQKAKRIKKQIH